MVMDNSARGVHYVSMEELKQKQLNKCKSALFIEKHVDRNNKKAHNALQISIYEIRNKIPSQRSHNLLILIFFETARVVG